MKDEFIDIILGELQNFPTEAEKDFVLEQIKEAMKGKRFVIGSEDDWA